MKKFFPKSFFEAYFSPRVLSIGFFAFPYGMMFFLAVTTPQIWLKEIGIDHTSIGLFALVSIPYVIKFLWAPMVDAIKIPFLHRLGQRRSWLLLVHVCLVLGLIMMGQSNPSQGDLMYTGCIACILAFFAATQDIIIDAYRIEILNKDLTGPGISMLIFGYRLGSITAKAGPLYLAHNFSWPLAYIVMAMLIGIGIIATLMNPEPPHPKTTTNTLYQTVVLPFQEFANRSSLWPLVFLFVIFYRFGDAMINNMAAPFYLDIGFTKTQIASVTGIFGICATIVGGFLGGALVRRYHIFKCLLVCGLLHAFSNSMFMVLAYFKNDLGILYGSVAVENITGGMTTAAFFVYLSRLCKLNFAATQFALLTSLWSLSTPLASFSGWVVDQLHQNWISFFFITIIAALPGILLIAWLPKYQFGNEGAMDSVS
ncbi:MAG: MFS transporter [Alphaproteobacteria bacterium]